MTADSKRRLLVVQAAALGWDFVQTNSVPAPMGREWQALGTVFPAVTCTVQATFRTGVPPGRHGVIANGWMDRAMRRTFFWEQSAALVAGERIWSGYRAAGHRVAMLYWQQSLGESVDMLLSPAPIHKHHGGMIDSTASQPAHLYATLVARVGAPFKLRTYWGPMASVRSSDWIARATAELLKDEALAPDLCLTYLPGLDYDLQRFGPEHARAATAMRAVREQLTHLLGVAEAAGYDWLVFGDYAIVPAQRAVFPNRALLDAGLLTTRDVSGRSYADMHASRAFAVADHEVAHVYVHEPGDLEAVRSCLLDFDGVAKVIDPAEQEFVGMQHARGGELVALAEDGAWFAYDWWAERSQAPDYAGHVDIHNKPGFDPRELFWGWPPGSVSVDASRVGGTHGKAGDTRNVAMAASFDTGAPQTLLDLSRSVGRWLADHA